MLCFRLSISGGLGLSQTLRKAWVRGRSRLFGSPGVAHLPGSSVYGWFRVRSRQLLLIRVSWRQIFVRPLSIESMDGDRWITGAAFPSTLDGHPPDVHPFLFAYTASFLGSSSMGVEDGPSG